jgi:hypothetical protein
MQHPNAWLSKPVELEQVGQFVYALFKDSTLVYIGKTEHIRGRFEQHKQSGKDFNGALYHSVPASHVKCVEGAMIRHYRVDHDLVNISSGKQCRVVSDDLYMDAYRTGDYSKVDALLAAAGLTPKVVRGVGNGAGVAESWTNPETRAKREERHDVEARPVGETEWRQYDSVPKAWEDFGIDKDKMEKGTGKGWSRCIKFRTGLNEATRQEGLMVVREYACPDTGAKYEFRNIT